MDKKDFLIGSHCSMNSPEFYLGTVREAISYDSSCFMFYTGAPQNSFRKPLNELKIEEGRRLLKENNFDESKIIVHAPYIINPANPDRKDLRDMSVDFMVRELKRTAGFGCKTIVLHPGNHLGAGPDAAIKCLDESLDQIFEQDGTDVRIAIETMSGKGSEIGITFEQVAQIINGCKYPERLGVCLDTCHVSDAGYDIHDVDGLLNEFNKIIGLNKLLVVHLNDSKNPRAAHKDRHENLGYGYIGFETLNKIAHHPLLANVPKILETPYYNDEPPYKKEIAMLRGENFIDGWREN